jgi:hypothetical protein
MDNLVFYQQKRRDGGVRTGISFNDERVVEEFEPGDLPRDPGLLWFVEVRGSGAELPYEEGQVKEWFLARGERIRRTLREYAEELRVGLDADWPLKKEVAGAEANLAIYCSAIRRMSGPEISDVLLRMANEWEALVSTLGRKEPVIALNG